MSNRITFDQVSTPNFSDVNTLLMSGGQQYQNAAKGLADTLKGVQTEVRSNNNAKIQNYLNQATAEQLQNPEFRQGYQNLLNSLKYEYDAEAAAKNYDARIDTLKDRRIKDQQFEANQQTIDHNTVMFPLQETATRFRNNRDVVEAQQEDNLGLAYSLIGQGKTAEAQALMASLGKNAPIAFGTINTLDQQQQNQENWQKTFTLSQNADTRAERSDKREQGLYDAGAPGRALNANVAAGQLNQFLGENPQIGNPTYASDVQKFITPQSVASLKTYQPHLEAQSQRTGLPVELLTGIFGTETAFGLRKDKSSAGAVGAMQIMPATGKNAGYGVSALKDGSDAESFRFGADYLKAMIGNFNGDVEKGVAAYNAGAGRVQQAINQANKSGKDWKQYLPSETQTYVSRVGNIQNYFRSGNEGNKLRVDPSINVPTYNAASPTKFSESASGILTTAANNISNFNAGMVADKAKVMNDNTVNADTWLKGRGAWGGNLVDGVPKSLYGLIKGQYSNGNTGEIIKGVDQLSPAQQAQALEMAEQSYKAGKATNNGEFNVTTDNLKTLKSHLQNSVNSLLKGDADKSNAYANAQIGNAIRTVVARGELSPEEALASLGVSDQLKQNYIESLKAKPAPQQQAPKDSKPSSDLSAWVAEVKFKFPKGIPDSLRNSLKGRQAAQAGLW